VGYRGEREIIFYKTRKEVKRKRPSLPFLFGWGLVRKRGAGYGYGGLLFKLNIFF